SGVLIGRCCIITEKLNKISYLHFSAKIQNYSKIKYLSELCNSVSRRVQIVALLHLGNLNRYGVRRPSVSIAHARCLLLCGEVLDWTAQRNEAQTTVEWKFAQPDVRRKLHRHYEKVHKLL